MLVTDDEAALYQTIEHLIEPIVFPSEFATDHTPLSCRDESLVAQIALGVVAHHQQKGSS